MFAQVLPLLAALSITPALAQDTARYTVWASVIFSRTGERTPEVLGSSPITLTSVGALEQQANGQFFRQRYLESSTNFSTDNGIGPAPLRGMSPELPDVQKLYVQALDEQCHVASAQAFLQGLYPPVSFAGNSSQLQEVVDPTSRLGNGSYVSSGITEASRAMVLTRLDGQALGPLDGYRYGQIHTSGMYDPEFVYVGGSLECPAFVFAVENYIGSAEFAVKSAATSAIYEKIGPAFLGGVLLPDRWGFINAYAIYDYLSYQNEHNSTAQELFASDEYKDPDTGLSYLETLHTLSNDQQYAWFGNKYAKNDITGENFEGGVEGSISTIAGNTLASKLLGQLQTAIAYEGAWYQLSLLFGDYEPMLSLFSLVDLPPLDSNFYGMPDYGSTVTFELFSYADSSDVTFPSEEDLWVRFWFRNGSDPSASFQSYPLFNWGPDASDMHWLDFQTAMLNIAVTDVGEWCQQCGASYIGSDRIFCSFWNASDSIDGGASLIAAAASGHHHGVSPAVAGAIGAIVTLVVAGLLFGLLMLIAGVRLHRVQSRKSEMGGFKGSQKLASDQDLTLPKGGAIVGATIETPASPVVGGHERVGSWELKQNDLPNIAASHPTARRPSFEEDDIGSSPFRPVKPDERV